MNMEDQERKSEINVNLLFTLIICNEALKSLRRSYGEGRQM